LLLGCEGIRRKTGRKQQKPRNRTSSQSSNAETGWALLATAGGLLSPTITAFLRIPSMGVLGIHGFHGVFSL
jgi:hypothetical protein